MKKLLYSFLLLNITVCPVFGQEFDSLTLSKLKTNFVVPDLPAFKSLNIDPSNLLRPSTPKAFAVSLSEFYSQGKIIMPEAFAAEITPAQLLNANKPKTLEQYAKNGVGNSFRISLGTARDTSVSSNGRKLAIGFRVNLINKGELATDTEYLKQKMSALRQFMSASMILRKDFAALKGIDTAVNASSPWDEELDAHPDWVKEFKEKEADTTFVGQQLFLKQIKAIKEDYRKRHWNDERLDVALALTAYSQDSFLSNIQYNRADFWLTYATGMFSDHGQFLIGCNANAAKNLTDTVAANANKIFFNLSIPARLLIGTNRIKGFAEIQYSYIGSPKTHNAFLNLGAELNIVDGVWVNLYGGIDYDVTAQQGRFKTNLDIKLTLPENFNFF